MRQHVVLRFGFAAVAALLVGCASAAGGAGEDPASADPNAVAIQVTNAIVPPVAITLWIRPETGSRRRLGTISPNGRATFSYVPTARGMEHQLVAEHVDGESTTSNPFVLTAVTGVTWQTSSPTVQLVRGAP